MMISRPALIHAVNYALEDFPVALLLGPRQCGKTTLARELWKSKGGTYFDLEDPETPLQTDRAKLVLNDLHGLVIIDEFQRQPELFPLLRVLADRRPSPARFLILGSASLDLVRGISESLAGRVAYVTMGGFSLTEAGHEKRDDLWTRGAFPRAFLAKTTDASYTWRSNFMQSFLERDIPQLGIRIPAPTLRRFWTMVAHYHGNIWNAAEFARSLGTKEDTARRYLDILSGAFMIRQLHPWFENIGKRLVKAPKVYLQDSGLLHALLGLKTKHELLSHPKLGFSWEGFALEQVLRLTGRERDAYYYKTYAGSELDLLLIANGKRYGFEFKYQDSPRVSRSMRIVFDDLNLDHLAVLYPGERTYSLGSSFRAIGFLDLPAYLSSLGLLPEDPPGVARS